MNSEIRYDSQDVNLTTKVKEFYFLFLTFFFLILVTKLAYDVVRGFVLAISVYM